ncbi:TPA: hypothetical protein ACX6RX_003208 [Photobacterium damselae]
MFERPEKTQDKSHVKCLILSHKARETTMENRRLRTQRDEAYQAINQLLLEQESITNTEVNNISIIERICEIRDILEPNGESSLGISVPKY